MAKARRKVAVSKKVVVKKGTSLVEVPFETVKAILADVGFAGNLLVKATNQVFTEVKRVAKAGVVNTVDFEKAIIKGVKKTNDVAANTTKKLTRRILR